MDGLGPHRVRSAFLVASAALLAAMACRFSSNQLPTPTEIGFIPLTEVASITPPPPERRTCPVPSGQADVPDLSELQLAAPNLQAYLNDGGDARHLTSIDSNLSLARPDIDGDGWVDLAFALSVPDDSSPQATGQLLLYHCQDDRYQLAYASQPEPNFGPPTVESTADLNGDGADDLLVLRQECGAHTCTGQVQALVWNGETLANRLDGRTDDLPSPDVQVQMDDGGQPEIAITAQGVASVGAGPFRPVTRVWAWDPGSKRFVVVQERQHETNFRIHVLLDADAEARAGDLAAAEADYRRVIDDDSLQGWVDPARERRILSGYAQFRLVTSALQAGDADLAQTRYQQLLDQYSGDPAAGGYAELGTAFWLAYQSSGQLTAGCQAANGFAAAHAPTVLDPLYFGYANPTYSASDICPLLDP
jgi:hypothetical protein